MKYLPLSLTSLFLGSSLLLACESTAPPGGDPLRTERVSEARSATTACICPDTMPDSESFSVPDAVSTAAGQEGEFQCFGACGRSCNCAGRQVNQVTVNIGVLACTYEVITCNTHPFCRWHDTCFKNCDEMFPGVEGDSSQPSREDCYSACNASCLNGQAPNWAWCPPELDPGTPPGQYGIGTCAGWGLSLASSPSDGTLSFSRLIETGVNNGDGTCCAADPGMEGCAGAGGYGGAAGAGGYGGAAGAGGYSGAAGYGGYGGYAGAAGYGGYAGAAGYGGYAGTAGAAGYSGAAGSPSTDTLFIWAD